MSTTRAGGGLLAVGRGEGRAGVLLQLAEVEILVVDAVADLVLTASVHDVRGLCLELPAVAAVAGLIEPQPTRADARSDTKVVDLPVVDGRLFEDAIERVAQRCVDEKVRAQHTGIADVLIVAAVLQRAVAGRRLVQQRPAALRAPSRRSPDRRRTRRRSDARR